MATQIICKLLQLRIVKLHEHVFGGENCGKVVTGEDWKCDTLQYLQIKILL